ncbi:MAG TPA: peptidase M28 [Flavobacteriaceae bacterium]|nr:peptidase M28 [Flavobacteriaceae bacterium]
MLSNKYISVFSFLIIIATIYLSFSTLMPKKISNASTPLTEFSTERALVHLKEITKKPHYIGTGEHKKVREYIVNQLQQLGLTTEIQQQVTLNGKFRAGTTTQNIIAKIKGTDAEKTLLLLTHYDSAVHSSLGASDAGSGVVTILESVRVFLAKNKQPKNDIIILISDAEEIGLLGASAFVNHHPWAKDVGVVLNFEARGSGGPSYMLLETNGGNKKLIEHFVAANPKYPLASSLMYSIYKMLPNDTDLTIFREDGDIEGYNFAFIDDHYDYHTVQDSYKRLDKNTLEHQGTYLMALLDYFADADLSNLKSETDYVYFNLPYIGMVYYPFSWILPMLIVLSLLFIGLLIYGFTQQKIKLKGLFIGFIPFLGSLILSGLITVYGWKLLLKIHPQYQGVLHGFTYNGHWYIAAFSALTLALCFMFYKKHFEKEDALNLMIAPIFIWLFINIAVAIYLKGAGYFIMTLLYGVVSLALYLFSKKENLSILLTVLSIPILLVFAPLIQMLPVGLGLKMLVVSSVFIVLLFGLLIPVFSSYKNHKNLGRLFLVLSIIIFISASFKSKYSVDRKQPNSIMYVLDADKNEAYWATYDKHIDEFTKQFLGDNPTEGSYDNLTTSSKYGTNIQWHKKAKVKTIIQPVIEIVKDTLIANKRSVHVQIKPQRMSNRIEFISKNPILIESFKVNGQSYKKPDNEKYVIALRDHGKTVLSYYLALENEMLDIEMTIIDPVDPGFFIYETSYDLLESMHFNFKPRTETMMPTPFVINDAIVVKKQINLVLN